MTEARHHPCVRVHCLAIHKSNFYLLNEIEAAYIKRLNPALNNTRVKTEELASISPHSSDHFKLNLPPVYQKILTQYQAALKLPSTHDAVIKILENALTSDHVQRVMDQA